MNEALLEACKTNDRLLMQVIRMQPVSVQIAIKKFADSCLAKAASESPAVLTGPAMVTAA